MPFLAGEPGIGKSSFILDFFKNNYDAPCFVLNCNTLASKEDLTGVRTLPVIGTDGKPVPGQFTQRFFPAEAIRVAMQYAEDNPDKTVGLALDEINRCPSDVTSAVLTMVTQRFFPAEAIRVAMQYAEDNPDKTVGLALDEINRCPSDVTSAVLTMVTARTIGDKTLPENLRLICAGNDKGNISALDDASLSRFAIYQVEPDTTTYLKLDEQLHPIIAKVLKDHPDVIMCRNNKIGDINDDDDNTDITVSVDDAFDDANAMLQFTTPRTISSLSRWLKSVDTDFVASMAAEATKTGDGTNSTDSTMLHDALIAHVGDTAFTDYVYTALLESLSTAADNNGTTPIESIKPTIYDQIAHVYEAYDANTTEGNTAIFESMNEMMDGLKADEVLGIAAYAMTNDAVGDKRYGLANSYVLTVSARCINHILDEQMDTAGNIQNAFTSLNTMAKVLSSGKLNQQAYASFSRILRKDPNAASFVSMLDMIRNS